MGYFERYHIFRDPIHGFIKVYDIERDIINSSAFQRLRRIKQLALTCMVYHGAEHTRFGHSIGVMDVASRIFDVIVAKDNNPDEYLLKKISKWRKNDYERNKIILRLIALLHDIGHCPFSHGAEMLFQAKITHEEMSARIIEGDGEISQILDSLQSFNINKSTIANMLRKKEIIPPINQIIDGPLDADKTDYLWRDSFYTGVYYGRFDLDRLINTMTIVYNKVQEDIGLGLEEGGKYTAESLMLARYYMFLQVYFHCTRRAYDKHLSDFLKGYFKNYLNKNHYPSNVKEFLKFDDYRIMNFINEAKSKNNQIGSLAKIIIYRKHYEVLKESPDYTEDKEKNLFDSNFNKIKDKFNIEIFKDDANDAPNKFKKEPFYLKLRNPKDRKIGSRFDEIEVLSKVIKELDDKIRKLRIYVPKDDLNRCKNFSDNLNWKP